MYVHKDLQKCKYCSAHQCLTLRLPGKVALGHKTVTVTAAEANNEAKYICMHEECKTLALNHVPLRVWWYQFPSASAPLSLDVGVTRGSLLLLPTPWMSVHFTWQSLPEQSRWARNSFCCTGLSKCSNYAEICLKMPLKPRKGCTKRKPGVQNWVDRSCLISECISAAQLTATSHAHAFKEELKERQFPVWKLTGLCVWLFLLCCHSEDHRRCLYVGWFFPAHQLF